VDRVWDSAVKWKDALRQRRAAESRKRYGETFVPSEALLSSFSIRREINDADRFGGSHSLRKTAMAAKRRPNIQESQHLSNASFLHFGHGEATSLRTGRVKCFEIVDEGAARKYWSIKPMPRDDRKVVHMRTASEIKELLQHGEIVKLTPLKKARR